MSWSSTSWMASNWFASDWQDGGGAAVLTVSEWILRNRRRRR